MPAVVRDLSRNEQTGREMYRITDSFSGDIDMFDVDGVPLSSIPFEEYHRMIRQVPYLQDQKAVEIVTRPFFLLSQPWRGWDCKKKAIAVASWLAQNEIPYRFAAVSKRPGGEIHHVIPQAEIEPGKWVDVDATYPWNRPYQAQPWTAVEILSGDNDYRLSESPILVSLYGDDLTGSTISQVTQYFRSMVPEQMGQVAGIIAAIISAAATTTAAIIGAVSAKRAREQYASALQAEKARTAAEEQIAKIKAQSAAEAPVLPQNITDYGLPAAAGVALFALLNA